jgi:hypothetical protein
MEFSFFYGAVLWSSLFILHYKDNKMVNFVCSKLMKPHAMNAYGGVEV